MMTLEPATTATNEPRLPFHLRGNHAPASDEVVSDARDVAADPIARVPLPQRVPLGFHGSWIPDPE